MKITPRHPAHNRTPRLRLGSALRRTRDRQMQRAAFAAERPERRDPLLTSSRPRRGPDITLLWVDETRNLGGEYPGYPR